MIRKSTFIRRFAGGRLLMPILTGTALGLALPGHAIAQQAASVEAPDYRAVNLDQSAIVIPFRKPGPWINIDNVYVNNQGPYTFGFDTGASGGGRVDVSLAELQSLRPNTSTEATDGSGQSGGARPVYTLDEVRFGGLTYAGVWAMGGNYNTPGAVRINGGQVISGILGMGLFEHLLLTIDYTNHTLTISRGSLPESGGDVLAYADPERSVPTVPVQINDEVFVGRLDTGSLGDIIIGDDVAARVQWLEPPVYTGMARTIAGDARASEGRLAGQLRIGDRIIQTPRVRHIEGMRGVNLGGVFLNRSRLTLDHANRRLRLETTEP